MSYDIAIQPEDSTSVVQRSEVDSFIASLPGVRRESPGVFAYGDKRRRLFVHIYTGEADTIDSVGLSVPAAFTNSSGEQALLLGFQIADHLGWRVFDQQLGDFLDKSTAREALRSQKDFGNAAGEILSRRAAGESSFGEVYLQQFYCHSAWVLIPTLIVAALVAGYFIVQRGIAESGFPWLFCGAALVIHAVRALVCTIWRRISDEKKRAT